MGMITSKRIQLLRGEPRPIIEPHERPMPRVTRERPRIKADELPAEPLALPANADALTWAELCELYLKTMPTNPGAFARAESHFRRICKPGLVADVAEAMFDRFAAELAAEGSPIADVQRFVSNTRRVLKWAFDAELIDPARFPVYRSGDKWTFRTKRAAE